MSKEIKEILTCGREILVKVNCPDCSEEQLLNTDSLICHDCGAAVDKLGLTYSKAKKRVVATVNGRKGLGRISKTTVRNLQSMQENLCAYCGITLTEYHIEHIKPVSFGGNNFISNLCLSCPECNLTAGSLIFSNFSRKQEYIPNRRNSRKK